MRMNTLDNHKINSLKNYTLSNAFNTKLSFPNIFYSPNKSKISEFSKYKNKKMLTLKKYKIKHPEIISQTIHRNALQNIKMVKILTFDDKINDIFNTDLLLERQKEKINNNKTIKLLRLGLYKKKENNENDGDNAGGRKNTENNFDKILEKEKENEEDLEKINNENMEKELKLEKRYKEKLYDLEKIKNECININNKIIRINDKIEDNQMETEVLNNYGEEFDKKFEKKISQNIDDKNINDEELKKNFEPNETSRKKEKEKEKDKQFVKLNKLIIFKQQREDKKKFLKENINENEKIKQELENELIIKKNLCNKYKKELDNVKKQLINSYHLKLYEGLNIHNEGLSSIIKDIWNLGVNVNINFMPTYLDNLSIEFLFQRAKYSLEIAKIRQLIKNNEKELSSYLKEWKLNNEEINNIFNKINSKVFYESNDEHKNTVNSINEKELFKTKISDISISYLDPYPKTKEFIIEYKKKHPQLFQIDMPDVDIKHLKFKSFNIPGKILEKNKNIEKMKYLLSMKIEQNKQNDKKEVQRLNKEFIKNNYQEKYKVNVENLFGALFGDKKNEMLIYYTKLEKEYRDGSKVIQFHTKYNKLK